MPRSSAVDACCAARACRENAFRVQWLFSREIHGRAFLHEEMVGIGASEEHIRQPLAPAGRRSPPVPQSVPDHLHHDTFKRFVARAPRCAPEKERDSLSACLCCSAV